MKRKLCPARRAANRSIARTPSRSYISLRLRHSIHFLYSESSGVRMNKLILIVALVVNGSVSAQTWRADNGDGTFTNPLFYDEFSDPDLIRVGEDYYLTGTTMHSMPGLPVLHSKDLVNWKFLGYAFDRLDL